MFDKSLPLRFIKCQNRNVRKFEKRHTLSLIFWSANRKFGPEINRNFKKHSYQSFLEKSYFLFQLHRYDQTVSKTIQNKFDQMVPVNVIPVLPDQDVNISNMTLNVTNLMSPLLQKCKSTWYPTISILILSLCGRLYGKIWNLYVTN